MTEQAPISATTVTEMMRRRAALTPDAQYFSLFDSVVTYGQLWETSGRYATGLARAGVAAGDRVTLIYPTCAEFFYTFFGALRLGAVPVPLYPTLGVEGTARILDDSGTTVVATIGWFRKGVDESVALTPSVRAVVEPNDLEQPAPAPPLHPAGAEDLAFLQYTSGSTGRPRGVMLTHANVVATIRFMAEAAGISTDDRVVSWLPLYHDMGLIGCSLTPPLLGTPIWLLPPDLRNPREWLALITKVRATFTVSPDFGYRNCVRHVHDTTDLDLSTLKAALSGAEPVRRSTIETFEAHFGLKRVISPCYGLAEATLAVAIWPREVELRYDPTSRFVSVGKPCRGVAVRIAEPRDDPARATVLLPTGAEGEICVQSPGVMRGYWNNPEATAQVLEPGGWLRTGDLGFVDDTGYLYVTGRLKDVIILGGRNISPTDLEEAPNAGRHLRGNQHHPRTFCPHPRNRALPFSLPPSFSRSRWTSHIQTAYRAQIHTNATVDTGLFIHLKTIGHVDLLSESCNAGSLSSRKHFSYPTGACLRPASAPAETLAFV